MNEKELGKALLQWEALERPAAKPPDLRQLTVQILQRDRRQVALLTGLTVLFWVLTTTVIAAYFILYFAHFQPRLDSLVFRLTDPETQQGGTKHEQWIKMWYGSMELINRISQFLALGSVAALVMAATCTVLLVFALQRATLRRVNANLAEISEQLKQLRQVLGK